MTPSGSVCAVCGQAYESKALFCPKDGAPLGNSGGFAETDPYLGGEIIGQIRLERLIGIGSMGRVYRAFQTGLDRLVAVKILHRELSANAALLARFHQEAKVISRISHPNVVQVFMSGDLALEGNGPGAAYIVMEHLDGLSLRSALAASGGALPIDRALGVVLQICDAVGEAHAQGVVHRDLKPDNVMLVRRGEDRDFVKVLDFGMARSSVGDRPALTQAGLVFGTARYISPEGAAGQPVGPPADVYAIATILYEALSGRTPFEGESSVGLLAQHMNEPPPPITSIPRAASVPASLAGVIMQNLDKRPENRARDARALRLSLMAATRAGEPPYPAQHEYPGPEPPLGKTRRLEVCSTGDTLVATAPCSGATPPPSLLESPADGDDSATIGPPISTEREPETRSRWRTFAWLAACVVTGSGLAALGGYHWGLIRLADSSDGMADGTADETSKTPLGIDAGLSGSVPESERPALGSGPR